MKLCTTQINIDKWKQNCKYIHTYIYISGAKYIKEYKMLNWRIFRKVTGTDFNTKISFEIWHNRHTYEYVLQ